MTREQAREWFQSHMTSDPMVNEAFRMAIEALQREEAEEKGYCHRIKPKQDKAETKWSCTANFVAEQLERLKNMTDEERLKLLQTMFPSADAVQEWIPFTRRPMTEEEQKDYPNCTFIFDCVLPDDGDEILVSNGRFVWMDTFCTDIDGCYLDGGDDIDEDMAWMPIPEPYKGGEK